MTKRQELRRAEMLLAQLQPKQRNERLLNAEQRAWLTAWRQRRADAASTADKAAALYAESLEADFINTDPMRADIEAVLFPDDLAKYRILETDTDETATRKYYEYSQL